MKTRRLFLSSGVFRTAISCLHSTSATELVSLAVLPKARRGSYENDMTLGTTPNRERISCGTNLFSQLRPSLPVHVLSHDPPMLCTATMLRLRQCPPPCVVLSSRAYSIASSLSLSVSVGGYTMNISASFRIWGVLLQHITDDILMEFAVRIASGLPEEPDCREDTL